MLQAGCWGAASSRALCWLTPGPQGMRVSEQEGFMVAESQSQGLAPVLRRYGGEKGGLR